MFADFLCARTAIKCLQACDAQNFTETLAYVLMPDHLHWLFVLQQGELSDAMRRFKPNAAHAVNLMRGSVGQTLWQPGFHDRAIRHDDDLPTIACYVVANPIRAGLTRSVASYAHWDAVWF